MKTRFGRGTIFIIFIAIIIFGSIARGHGIHQTNRDSDHGADDGHSHDLDVWSHDDDNDKTIWQKIEWGFGVNGVLQGCSTPSGSGISDGVDGLLYANLECLIPVLKHGKLFGELHIVQGEAADGRIDTFSRFFRKHTDEHHHDGAEGVHLCELWYEHQWFDGRFRGRVGYVDLRTDFDTNEYANCEGEQFMSWGFISNLAMEAPLRGLGGMFWTKIGERWELGFGYSEDEETWNDLFRHGFGMLQLTYKANFLGRPGNYRVYGWWNGEDHEEWLGAGRTDLRNAGWGFSFDQEITNHLGLFFRYGTQNRRVMEIGNALSVGFQFKNFSCRREHDAIGFAYGCAFLSKDYTDFVAADPADGFETANEHHIEFYYRVHINKYIQITPDIQWVKNPAGNKEIGSAWVFGLRGYFAI